MTQDLILPTEPQIKWMACGIGVIIHFDVQVFEPDYLFRKKWGYTPDPSVFNPTNLDTDQWIATAKAAGAKYAVLVAKHCSGFSLWPTEAHDYSVRSSPWREGKGDLVYDFIQSCKKFGLEPGLYCSTSVNAYLNVDNPGVPRSGDPKDQTRYNRIVEMQLTELWSNYGELSYIWFDGGVLAPEKGGPDITPILKRLQPNAVVFQGPPDFPSLSRWIGNERGEAPYPFWNTTNELTADDGTVEAENRHGDPDGRRWVCGEADMPNRDQHKAFQGGWFWREGDDQFLYSIEHLVERYFASVGRNTNLLLGMVIDPRGLVPEADQAQFRGFGDQIRQILASKKASTSGTGNCLELPLPNGLTPTMLILGEDITQGERVRHFIVEAKVDGYWKPIMEGTSIGQHRIERIEPLRATALKLTILKNRATPQLTLFSALQVDEALLNTPTCSIQQCLA
jgi:alpha-L-fucosidase